MVENQYKTFWPRFVAGFIDGLVFMPITFLDEWVFDTDFDPVTKFIYYALVTILGYYIYSVFMHGKYGQTLGKMAVNIKVISVDGSHWGYKKAFLRDSVIIAIGVTLLFFEAPEIISGANTIEAVSNMVFIDYVLYAQMIWIVAEFVTMLTNNKRRAIHDFLAGSVVINLDEQPKDKE